MGVSADITKNLARQLIDNYGPEAAEAARERAEAMTAYGNSEAAKIWAMVGAILARRRNLNG